MSRAVEAIPGSRLPDLQTPGRDGTRVARIKDREPKPQRVILYAGTSERRGAFLTDAAENAVENGYPDVLVSRSGGTEKNISDVISIMRRKIYVAEQTLQCENVLTPKDTLVTVAADIRTRICGSRVNMGRPKTQEDVQKIFKKMAAHETPYYSVEAGTGVKFPGMDIPLTVFNSTTVLLDPKVIGRYTTDSGFEEYLEQFDSYHSSPVYKNGDKHPPINVTDLAAGLSLPVLARNAVLEVNGVAKEDENFRDAFKKGVYNVAIGFDLNLLAKIWPNIQQFAAKYQWLETVTAHAMDAMSTRNAELVFMQ
jgi:hypothetical protein